MDRALEIIGSYNIERIFPVNRQMCIRDSTYKIESKVKTPGRYMDITGNKATGFKMQKYRFSNRRKRKGMPFLQEFT